jgi:ribonucleoside-diphosphate reductase alpha chain
MEHQAFYLTEATVELAKERGACLHSEKTRYGQGTFPWELRAKGANELADFTPELDWETLRVNMKQYGVRNATLMAIAPVESSSVVINSTNGIEMPMSLITVKESKAGSLIQVAPEYNKLKSKYQLMWAQKDCRLAGGECRRYERINLDQPTQSCFRCPPQNTALEYAARIALKMLTCDILSLII